MQSNSRFWKQLNVLEENLEKVRENTEMIFWAKKGVTICLCTLIWYWKNSHEPYIFCPKSCKHLVISKQLDQFGPNKSTKIKVTHGLGKLMNSICQNWRTHLWRGTSNFRQILLQSVKCSGLMILQVFSTSVTSLSSFPLRCSKASAQLIGGMQQ